MIISIQFEFIMKKTIFILLISFLSYSYAIAQEKKFNLQMGASLPELYNIGAKYYYTPNTSIGIRMGTFFESGNDKLNAFDISHAFYFGRTNQVVNKKLWSLNSGLVWIFTKDQCRKEVSTHINLYIAKEFVINSWFGVQPELGYFIFLDEKVKTLSSGDCCLNGLRWFGLPKFGVELIFHL